MVVLRDKEAKVLQNLVNGYVDELANLLQINREELLRILYDLQYKGLVNIKQEEVEYYRLTPKGEKALHELPERKLLDLLRLYGELPIKDIPLEKDERNIAIGVLKKLGLIKIENGKVILLKEVDKFPWEDLLKAVSLGLRADLENLHEIEKQLNTKLDPSYLKELEKRGLITKERVTKFYVEVTEKGKEIQKDPSKIIIGIDKITPEVIASRLDEEKPLVEYNIYSFSRFYGGKPHFYREYINWIRKRMLNLGWQELNALDYEIVPMFWCFEALFTPYDHPSRELAESFLIESSYTEMDVSREILEKVKEEHLKYHGNFLEKEALLPILRSQVTTVTAINFYKLRDLLNRKKGKYFYIGRVWRPDTIDKTHHIEFHQLEGIIIDSSFAQLKRELRKIMQALGFEKIKLYPAYFPFTEPSVEGYAYHPKLGWIEVFGAGMIRKQILESFGINYKVGAFGIGLPRLAMINMGIDDIRDLYGRDLDQLREIPIKFF